MTSIHTSRLKQTLENATEIARSKADMYVGEEHVLLAMMKSEGVGGDVLREFGLDFEKVQNRIEEIRRGHLNTWIESLRQLETGLKTKNETDLLSPGNGW